MRRGRRSRRLECLAAGFAAGVNLLLFVVLGLLNRAPARPPAREDWLVREVFRAAPPPEEAPPSQESERVTLEERSVPPAAVLVELDPIPETPSPRLDPLILALPPPRLPGEPVPLSGVAFAANGDTAPGPLSLSQVDRSPEKTHSPLPTYPEGARLKGLEGVVELTFVVDREGNVRDVDVTRVEGDERFAEAAREAITRWKFKPALLDGKPVPVRCTQRMRFELIKERRFGR